LHVIDPTRKAWRIKPESATAFRPVGDTPFYRSARFHFRRASADQPHTLTLESNEQGFREVIEFRRVELAAPTAEAITEYAGEYVNRDLAATYRFEAREGVLWLRVGSRHWEQLDPTLADEFIPHVRTLHDNRIIRFRRDANHRIVGLAVSFWRVEDLEFQRRPARGAGDPERP
jgi:hypothetical protein